MEKNTRTLLGEYKMPVLYLDDIEKILNLLKKSGHKKYILFVEDTPFDNIHKIIKDEIFITNNFIISIDDSSLNFKLNLSAKGTLPI